MYYVTLWHLRQQLLPWKRKNVFCVELRFRCQQYKYCFQGNATIHSLCILGKCRCQKYKNLSVAIRTQEWVTLHRHRVTKYFAPLSTIYAYLRHHVSCPKCLPDFNQTWIFSTNFSKCSILNFIKISDVRAGFIHIGGQADGQTGRQTDMPNLIDAFRDSFERAELRGDH